MWRMFRMRRRQLLTKVTSIDDILSFVAYLLSLSIITLVVRGSRKTSFVLRRLLLSSYIVCLPSSDFVKISRGHKHSTGTVRFTIKRITASNTSRLCMLFTSIGTRSFWIICEKASARLYVRRFLSSSVSLRLMSSRTLEVSPWMA